MCCHITSLESCFVDVSYGSPLAVIQKWTSSLESSKTNEAWAKHVLDFLLIFWLNCNILTCSPTFCIFSVLYSSRHCSISSLRILQHPLLQTFMSPTSLPRNHQLSLQSFTSHTAIPSQASPTTFLLPPLFSCWYPWLSPTTFSYVFWPANWACSKLCGCWLAGQLLPLACQAWQTIPCRSAAGPTNGSEWGSVRLL